MSNDNNPIIVQIKKPNVFQRIKRWWKENLSEEEREIFKISGIFMADGMLIGAAIASGAYEQKMKKVAKNQYAVGYVEGSINAYREVAKNPYIQMDAAWNKLEAQGKVRKF